MKRFWCIVNIGFVILSLYLGYIIMTPTMLRHNNPDAILCMILLVGVPMFVLGSVSYSIHRWKCGTLRRPTWNRLSVNWWFDPLQSLYMSTWNMAAITLGSALRLTAVGFAGFWMVAVFFSITVGLLIGQILVYRIFRARIIDD